MPRPRTSRDASCNSNSPGNTTKDWNAVLYQFALGSQEAMADIDCSSFTLSSSSNTTTTATTTAVRKHRHHHQEAPRSCPPDLSSLSSAPPAVRSCSQSTSSSANTDLSSAFRENNYCYSDNGSSATRQSNGGTNDNLCGDCISPTVQQQEASSSHKSNKNGARVQQSQQPSQQQQQLAGETSPSSVCGQRKMSAAVVTTLDAKHDFLEGRPKILAQPQQPPARSRSSGFVSSMTTSFRSGSRSPTKTKKDKKSPTNSPKQQQQQRQQQQQLQLLQQRRSKQQNVPYLNQPEPLRLDAWEEAPLTENVKVRGKNYLTDGKKIPAADQGAAFELLTVDMIKSEEPILTGLCSHPDERIQRALQRERDAGKRELPAFVFAVNLCLPSADGGYYHCVSYFGTDDVAALRDPNTPFGRVAKRFFFGKDGKDDDDDDDDDAFRDATFKLIPRIEDGNFVVRKAVGTKPSILGNKIKQYYVRNARYFELVVHVGSDPLAQSIVKMALTYAKQLVVDMLFVLEGATEDALPERLLGGVRLSNVDFKSRDGQRIVVRVPAATSAAERPEE